MAQITLKNIAHRYGQSDSGASEYAVKPLDHRWEDGGAYALLGPSGCGKTSLLNIISGLVHPSQGQVLFDGVDVTNAATEQRNIAQVFQFPVVYDTMTVAENLAFPLRNRKMAESLVDQRVREVLAMLELGDLAKRRARGLAADIQQKISLGRGLVRTDVSALLFDEPLTVIDPALKWRLRAQIKLAHRDFSHTMIYVTHDQTEALTFADAVVVMLEGEVLQVGTPRDLFDAPAHTFVGTFIGSPGMNILPCHVNGNRAQLGRHSIELDGHFPALNADTELGIRPEHVELHAAEQYPNGLPATVLTVQDLGRFALVRLELGGLQLQALLPEGKPLPATPVVSLPPANIGIYHHSRRLTPVPA